MNNAEWLFDMIMNHNYSEIVVTIQEPYSSESKIKLNHTYDAIYYPNEEVISIRGKYVKYNIHDRCIRKVEVNI